MRQSNFIALSCKAVKSRYYSGTGFLVTWSINSLWKTIRTRKVFVVIPVIRVRVCIPIAKLSLIRHENVTVKYK